MLDILRIAIALSCLIYASYHDIKTRLIPSWIWWIMGLSALFLFSLDAYKEGKEFLLFSVPIAVVMIEALVERDDLRNVEKTWPFFLLYLSAIAVLLWGYGNYREKQIFLGALSATGISVFFFLLYSLNIIHGAADAKAMVMLSIMFYRYPFSMAGNGLEGEISVLFPFSLTVLFLASLIVALMPVYFLAINLMKGDVSFPEMLLGYRMKVAEAKKKKVWPMVRIVDGKLKRVLFPTKYMEIDWDAIENSGMDEVWVTPKIPFIVPITLGFILALIIGNPLTYFIT